MNGPPGIRRNARIGPLPRDAPQGRAPEAEAQHQEVPQDLDKETEDDTESKVMSKTETTTMRSDTRSCQR
ncbi:hypothetical protein L5515_016838 [Caenorhabditis briggsae]|uniref:Uncharacterized protein n=1 Tax=Caenorhabditis briggsae TaxID=6238 RepID=A0AAE9FF55_CAEBR|nr:hypothetical protein L5515_016838 [Caenorhabditis briggsae]